MSDPSLLTSYGSNLMATVTFAVIAGVVWCVKHKCKHAKWSIDSGCMKCQADDANTIRDQPGASV